jgi:trk system potassium uptake protein TrkA
MAIFLCKEVGVKTIIAKCANSRHEKILAKVGADKVVFPEREAGIQLAKNLLSAGFTSSILVSEGISIMNIDVPAKWVGKTLLELNLRKNYSVNVIGIQSNENISIDVNPNAPLHANDNLVVIAHANKIKKLMKDIG